MPLVFMFLEKSVCGHRPLQSERILKVVELYANY